MTGIKIVKAQKIVFICYAIQSLNVCKCLKLFFTGTFYILIAKPLTLQNIQTFC